MFHEEHIVYTIYPKREFHRTCREKISKNLTRRTENFGEKSRQNELKILRKNGDKNQGENAGTKKRIEKNPDTLFFVVKIFRRSSFEKPLPPRHTGANTHSVE